MDIASGNISTTSTIKPYIVENGANNIFYSQGYFKLGNGGKTVQNSSRLTSPYAQHATVKFNQSSWSIAEIDMTNIV